MKRALLASLILLASCAPAPQSTAPQPATRMNLLPDLPQVAGARRFSGSSAMPALRSNTEMMGDFLDLSFKMESGRPIPRFTRFDQPITVRLSGAATATTAADLRDLLTRLQREAGLDIAMTGAPQAQITVAAVPRAALQRAVPKAACFVVPRVSGWDEYLAARHTPQVDWTTLERRDRATLFVPADASPQEIRDCLHEEMAQALGPLNDLYRLPDSVFNDDNMHAVLTGFDMLVLRATYAPELSNGMSRGEVAARLPAIFARLNPRGARGAGAPQSDTTRAWISAMESALGSAPAPATRRDNAERALNLTRALNWHGTRRGFAHYVYGRLHVSSHPDLALAAFRKADEAYASHGGMQIQRAHVAVQLSAFALAAGQASTVMELTQTYIPVAQRHQNAALLATLMLFQAEALDLAGRGVEAQAVRLDSMGWARYGFGSDANVQARLREIAQLSPLH
ncbi:MAG: ATP-dependent transcriptional regulator [Rhodobacterales bacterium]|nr:MAG: ATP-dependent transcriptional regulator [Rhodobacterales bacterium]